jgi:hypothetical protein
VPVQILPTEAAAGCASRPTTCWPT